MTHVFALAVGGFIALAFLSLCGFAVYMVVTMVRDGWRNSFATLRYWSGTLSPPGVWPPPPEPGYICQGWAYSRIRYGKRVG